MNKYKKGFTPVEVALLSINIESYIKNEHWAASNQKVSSLDELKNTVRYIICDLAKLEFETQDPKYKDDLDRFTHLEEELIPQAENLKNALLAETLLTQQFEQGSSPKKSSLEIYVPFYDVKFNGEFDPEKTQLTKESLANWFDEADETKIANMFKPAKKIIPINPFKQSYTAEHAALIAVGLRDYNSIESAIEISEYQCEQIANAQWEVERGGEYTDFDVDKLLKDGSICNAANLKEALIDEIKLASEIESYNTSLIDYYEASMTPPSPPQLTDIVIYREELNTDQSINHSETLVTKESVATWLLNNGQTEYAKNILPNIEDLLKEKELAENQRQQQWGQAANSKTKEQGVKTTRTPESSLIDSLGLMAWLLSTKTTRLKRGDKPNASQIKTSIEIAINELGLNENTDNKIMFTNLNKDISKALKQLEGRLKL